MATKSWRRSERQTTRTGMRPMNSVSRPARTKSRGCARHSGSTSASAVESACDTTRRHPNPCLQGQACSFAGS
eukprot:6133487-Pleurochrysis_carterae.AAC.2